MASRFFCRESSGIVLTRMIYDYAIDPSLVASWSTLSQFRYFIEKFGLGTNRIVSVVPKKNWKRMAFESFKGSDIEHKRLEELINTLTETSTKRGGNSYDGTKAWFENIEAENRRRAFGSILTAHTIDFERDNKDSAWNADTTVCVSRMADGITKCVAPMLKLADNIMLVDPYFSPMRPQYRSTLLSFLHAALNNRSQEHPLRFEVHTSGSRDNACASCYFEADCLRVLPALIPVGQSVRVVRWLERKLGEKFHNRYVLTNFGGVSFGTGLDEGSIGQTDDVMLLGRNAFLQRFNQFSTDNCAFDLELDVLVSGCRS